MGKFRQVVATLALMVLGPICIITGSQELLTSRQLQAHGEKVEAAVVDGYKHRRRSSKSYYLTVSFNTAAGKNVQKSLRVDRVEFEKGQSAHQVPLFYLPEDPEVCSVGEKAETKFGTLLGGIAMLGGGLFLGLTLRR